MRVPPRQLICWIFAAALLPACQPGPTDPDGPVVRTPEPRPISSLPPRLASTGDLAVLPGPECRRCADPAGCPAGSASDVCLVQCSASGARRWDLGPLANHQCDPAAANFCEANGLGRLTDSCWGGYSAS